jgi:hypothetical protein
MKRLALFLPILLLSCDGPTPAEVVTDQVEVQFAAVVTDQVEVQSAVPDGGPAQYCKTAAPEQFFNACTVCAAQGSLGPIGETRTCACKTIMSGFFGPPPYRNFGECMQDWK